MTRRQTLILGVSLALLLLPLACSGAGERGPIVRYHCPMHPTMISDRPGDCPICGMRMVPIDEERTDETPPAPAAHPPSGDKKAIPGLSTVQVSSRRQQLIGMKTSLVARAPFRRVIRTVGRVTYDETRLKNVHAKISGYVEKLQANATGTLVRQGQPLLEIYSPELLASQQEYLVALRARARTAGSSVPSVAASGDELAASARRRLELFDLAEEQILALESTGQAQRTVSLKAPISGYVIERHVTQGDRIDPHDRLLSLADLSRVWVMAAVYEYELPFVHEGQSASVTLSYFAGKTFEGRVSLVYPVLDAQTRTAQVRLELPNPELLLKPEMYAEVFLEADLGERLALPETAVIESGERSIAFVDRGEGFFEPRELGIGLRLEDLYEVTSGVAEGERVLTSGNFFVDSESKLEAALAAAQ